MKDADRLTERRIAFWLASHYGVISRSEALATGLTSRQIQGRVESGTWVVLCRGVYRLAAAPVRPESRLRAAVLIGGSGCAVSHQSAAWLWGIAKPTDGIDSMRRVTITVTHNRSGRDRDFRVVRSRHPVRVVSRHGLPCTDPIRTIIDCAVGATAEDLDGLVDRALAQRIVRNERLVRAVGGSIELRHHRGRPLLVARLKARGVVGSPHPSVLESRFSRLLRRHQIPEPKAELWWGPDRSYRLDFAFPDLRLVIEVDGFAAHFAPEKQRYDRRRDNRLRRAGWTVLRYDWWEVTYDAARVAQEIAEIYRDLAAVA
jgi:very-short-patch-repair endonuclease